jgi:hypothetical protein
MSTSFYRINSFAQVEKIYQQQLKAQFTPQPSFSIATLPGGTLTPGNLRGVKS